MEKNVGSILKQLRKEKRLTLKDLSEMTDLSTSFLSQVERSKSSITLQSLSKISDALEVSRSYFFPESNQKDTLIDKADGKGTDNEDTNENFQINQANFIYQSLSSSNIANPLYEPMLVILFPNNYKNLTSTHRGQEFVYVLEGVLTVVIGDKENELVVGNSFHIDSSTPHTWFNNTDEVVKLLYVQSFPNR
jgi:transcriptional regulator with XRE-family HTH domain